MRNSKISDLAADVNDVIVCDVDKNQKQSFYIYCDSGIYYAEIIISGSSIEHCSHNNSIEYMYEYFKKYPSDRFNFYNLEYMKVRLKGLTSIYNDVIEKMEELDRLYGRNYKINKLLKK